MPIPKPNSTLEQYTDAALLAEIASRSNPLAYEVFYRRWERRSYNLALRITNNPDHAAEVVQESMLRVWRFADRFKPTGNAPCWYQRLVVREALQCLERRCLQEARVARKAREQTQTDQEEERLLAEERSEEMRVLRQALQTLPPLQQQLVALHYGGGLSQGQIGQALKMPKTTVSLKLAEALRQLRRRLEDRGLGALAPKLLGPEPLSTALGLGSAAPSGLQARVLGAAIKVAGDPATPRQDASRRCPRLVCAGAALAATLAVAWSLALTRPESASGEGAVEASRVFRVGPAGPRVGTPRPSGTSLPYPPVSWTFEEPGQLEAVVFNGQMIRGRRHKTASTWLYAEQPAKILLPVRLTAQPHLVTAHWCPVRAGLTAVHLIWSRDDLVPGARLWQSVQRKAECRKRYVMKLLLFEDRILKLEEGVPSEEVTYDRPYPGDRLVLSLTNAALDELSIRALRPEEMVELQRLKPNFEGSSTERLGPLPDEEIPDSPLHLCL